MLLRGFPRLTRDFAVAAAQIMGEEGADERILGLIDFAVAYAQSGWEVATDAIQANSGIPVDITEQQGERGRRTVSHPGYLVGLFGINSAPTIEGRFLYGVAVVEDRFVAVRVLADGTVLMDPEHSISPLISAEEIVRDFTHRS